MSTTAPETPSEATPTVQVTSPANVTVQFPDGGSLSLYIPNVDGDRTAAIKKRLTDAAKQF